MLRGGGRAVFLRWVLLPVVMRECNDYIKVAQFRTTQLRRSTTNFCWQSYWQFCWQICQLQ